MAGSVSQIGTAARPSGGRKRKGGGDGAAQLGAEAMEDAEAEAGTEKQDSGAGSPAAHPIDMASTAAVGGPVSGDRSGRGGEQNDAGYTPAHFTGAAPAALVGGPVSARLAPSFKAAHRKERGDKTPWSAREEADTADEATEERAPPNGRAHLTRAAKEGKKGEGESPPSNVRPGSAVRERGGPPRGGPLEPEGGP